MLAVNTRAAVFRSFPRHLATHERPSIKFDVEITKQKRIKGLDKSSTGRRRKELPESLNWALRGLARLRAQNGFTESESENDEIEDYKKEVNPARAFLSENVEESQSGQNRLSAFVRMVQEVGDRTWVSPDVGGKFREGVKRKFPKDRKRKSRDTRGQILGIPRNPVFARRNRRRKHLQSATFLGRCPMCPMCPMSSTTPCERERKKRRENRKGKGQERI